LRSIVSVRALNSKRSRSLEVSSKRGDPTKDMEELEELVELEELEDAEELSC